MILSVMHELILLWDELNTRFEPLDLNFAH